jgi:PhnB protein
MRPSLTPVLNVRGAAAAVGFYGRVFAAREVHRNAYANGALVVEMAIGGARLRIADEAVDAGNPGPEALGGTSVRINLLVEDPDAVVARAVAAGAKLVAPVADQPYGLRQGRIEDPFGHHWLIGAPLEGPSGDWARE